MNSGVCIKGSCYNDYERDYYGLLVDIVELHYPGLRNFVVLFKCDWFDIEKGMKVHPRHGLVEVKHRSRLATNEPFVLADQAQQVYYMTYPSRNKERRDWWVICKTRARKRVDIPLSDTQDEDYTIEGYYQEDEMSTPVLVGPITELDELNILVDGENFDYIDEENGSRGNEEEDEEEKEEDEDEDEDEDDDEDDDEDEFGEENDDIREDEGEEEESYDDDDDDDDDPLSPCDDMLE